MGEFTALILQANILSLLSRQITLVGESISVTTVNTVHAESRMSVGCLEDTTRRVKDTKLDFAKYILFCLKDNGRSFSIVLSGLEGQWSTAPFDGWHSYYKSKDRHNRLRRKTPSNPIPPSIPPAPVSPVPVSPVPVTPVPVSSSPAPVSGTAPVSDESTDTSQ